MLDGYIVKGEIVRNSLNDSPSTVFGGGLAAPLYEFDSGYLSIHQLWFFLLD